MNNYKKEIDIMVETLKKAGENLMRFFHSGDYEISEKSPNNPVTEADFTTNQIIIDSLYKYFPNDAILSEEISKDLSHEIMDKKRFEASRVWIIDPLDGTKEFVNGIKEFSISVGLVENNKALLGFIYNPALEYFIYGGCYDGLFKNGKPFSLNVENINSIEDIKICVSRTEKNKGLYNFIKNETVEQNMKEIGSVAYKLALVAGGEYNLTVSVKPKNEWDIAAGVALLEASGLVLLDKDYEKIKLNKKDVKSSGLIGGSAKAIEVFKSEYKNFI